MKPIVFNSDTVRAILENRKSQTRRVVKVKKGDYLNPPLGKIKVGNINGGYFGFCSEQEDYPCPFGKIGSKLWVRESCWVQRFSDSRTVFYSDDNLIHNKEYMYDYRKISSIHMPRWASRITLEITDIRVEREKGEWEWVIDFKVLKMIIITVI